VRTIVIGDVHGCLRELDDLLSRLGPGADDSIYFVGDLIARGPDSRGVLDRVASLGAKSVVGNHEHKLLEARAERRKGEKGPRLGPHHERLLDELEDHHWRQLRALPLWLELPDHDARIVHAGMVPGIAIEEQEPWVLTRMRTIKDDGSANDKRGGTLWGKLLSRPPHVIFGHNAVDGLQLYKYATGLDTGCVYGGKLSALVLPAATSIPPVQDRLDAIVSVDARAAYVPMTAKTS
jgi:hypothetical protein